MYTPGAIDFAPSFNLNICAKKHQSWKIGTIFVVEVTGFEFVMVHKIGHNTNK